MEYLTRRATRYKREGKYNDDDLENILKELEADEIVVSGMTEEEIDSAVMNEMQLVQAALDKGLLQPQGIIPNTKQEGIFRLGGETCNGLNNRINSYCRKVAAALCRHA